VGPTTLIYIVIFDLRIIFLLHVIFLNNNMRKKLMMVDRSNHPNKFQTHNLTAPAREIETKQVRKGQKYLNPVRQNLLSHTHLRPSYTALSPRPNLARSPQQRAVEWDGTLHWTELGKLPWTHLQNRMSKALIYKTCWCMECFFGAMWDY